MLFKRKSAQPTQSLSIRDSKIINSQIGQAGKDIAQRQESMEVSRNNEGLTTVELIAMLARVEETIWAASLSTKEMKKATDYLNAAKQGIQESEPDKEMIAKNLKRMSDALKTTNETVKAGKTLWETVQSMLLPVIGWLGTARHLIGF